jgi:hypothetical protein
MVAWLLMISAPALLAVFAFSVFLRVRIPRKRKVTADGAFVRA